MSRVREVLDGWGEFTVDLTDTAPGHLLRACSPWDHGGAIIRVYAGPVTADQLDDIMPLWSGPILRQTSEGRRLSGPGPSWWLGDNDGEQSIWLPRRGYGPFTVTPIVMNGSSTGSLTDWATAALDDTNSGLTLGTVSGPSYLRGGTIQAYTARTILASYLRVRFGVGYRVNPDHTVDIAPFADLHAQSTYPVSTRRGGRGGSDAGLQVTSIDLDIDATAMTTGTVVRRDGGLESATGVTGWRNPAGDPLNWRRIVDNDTMESTEAGELATAMQAEQLVTRAASISTADYQVTGRVRVGQRLDIWDPTAGFLDGTMTRHHRGEVIHPVRLRLWGADWPITSGMSVWLDRRHLAAADALDLTDHVAYADGADTTLTVGAPPKTMGRMLRR